MKLGNSIPSTYLTPYKYGFPVLTGSGQLDSFHQKSVDIPFVFWHNGQFYMMFVGYDGIGYQTGMAVSDDLLHWETKGVILPRDHAGRWDSVGCAGTWIIKESNSLKETPTLKKIEGRYWMVYHSYPDKGYEAGPAKIGLAWCEDESLMEWHKLPDPVFSWEDGEAWEQGGLYKACILSIKNKYYMFYNAKTQDERWIEQTGLAVSDDLFHWIRHDGNPILKVTDGSWDSKFVSDPYIVEDQGKYLNYYFGYDYEHAREGLAFSEDLIHWEKWKEPIIPNGAYGSIDAIHAHKASILWYNGILYHFYTAVMEADETSATNMNGEFRCITVAASVPWPKFSNR